MNKLRLVIDNNADFIIRGDEDLLVLNPFEEIEIITAEFFVNQFIEV